MSVIVIGAGIVGASTAYHLATRGEEVVVVDRGDDGQATAAGAGILFPWPLPDTPPALAALGLAVADRYPALISELAAAGIDDHGYRRVGGMTVAHDSNVLDGLHRGLLSMREQPGMSGLGEIELLGPGEPAARFAALDPDLGAVWASGIARVDGRLLRDALLRAAEAHGATRRRGDARLEVSRGGLARVSVDTENLAADAVVVAAGAWSRQLCEPLGVTLPVSPQRGQILHVTLPGEDTGGWPVIRTLGEHYLLGFPGGRVVAGATRESGAGFDHRVTAGGVHRVLTDALAVAPGLADGTVAEVRVGFRPVSGDGLPLLGTVDRVAGLVVATGLGAVGLTYGPYTGAVAADLALGRAVSLDLRPFRPDRALPGGPVIGAG